MDRRLFLGSVAASAAAQIEDLDALAQRWNRIRSSITTPEDLETRNAFVRKRMRDLLQVPARRPRVNARITGSIERGDYTIERLLYESGPDLWVTASLYVPKGAGRKPTVIVPCGHYELGRLYPDYQFACIELVRAGFVVLIYDPPGQGERRALNPPMKATEEHSLAGHLLLLIGENLTAHMVRDGMLAIDYLLTRPEVDANRIGCAGHSGGGTLTMFLACADERIRCVAINEGGTYHRWPVRPKADGGLPISDVEQNLFPTATDGIDICDMHVAIAPRPLLVTIEEYAPAFNETADHIRARYDLLGVADRFSTEEARARHAWTPKLRAATVQWFARWFYESSTAALRTESRAEAPETLYCTPNGQGNGQTIFSYVRHKASSLPVQRRTTRDDVRRVLRITADRRAPAAPGHGPVLFVDGSLPDPARWADLTAEGLEVQPVTVRQIGPASKPHLFDRETALQYMAWYADRCLFGDRVTDLLAAIKHEHVRLIGRGMGALLALYAAALDERVETVVCDGGLISYRALAQCDRPAHGANVVVRDVLLHFDLPDVAALVAPRKLVLREPVDGARQPVPEAVVQSLYGPAVRVVPAATPYAECLKPN
jgi:dienelactone hydrolase